MPRGVSTVSVSGNISGVEHLPVRHPLSPFFVEANGGHAWQELLEGYPAFGQRHARLRNLFELDGLTESEFTTARPPQRLEAGSGRHEFTSEWANVLT